MNLSTLTQGEPWMTPQEQELNRDLIGAIANHLAEAGVPENALITLRVSDVASTWFLARRLELALTPAEGEPPPCPTPAQAGAIGKCRERLRKAMKELEACCAHTGSPAPRGLADQMQGVIQKVRAAGLVKDTPFGDELINGDQDPESAGPKPTEQPAPGEQAPGAPVSVSRRSEDKPGAVHADPPTPGPCRDRHAAGSAGSRIAHVPAIRSNGGIRASTGGSVP